MKPGRLTPPPYPDLVQLTRLHQFGDPRPGVAHGHAEVVGKVARGGDAMRACGQQHQFALGLLATQPPLVIFGRDGPLGELVHA